MIVTTEYVDIPLLGSPMRTFVAAPKAGGRYPGIWCSSDIFQLTPPLLRFCVRLAGYGFVAAAPEIYRRIEAPGTVIPFDDAGRARGQQDAAKTPVAHFDGDCRADPDWLKNIQPVAQNLWCARLLYRRASGVSCGIPAGCPAADGMLLRNGNSRRQTRAGRGCRIARARERNPW